MIICGYAGIGKSYLAKNFPNVIDLESTPFEKDWDRYLKCAMYYSNQGYLVLLSCHKEIRELVCKNVLYNQRFTIVPSIESKEEYKIRYINRGNTQEFIDLQMSNWEKWLDESNNSFLTENWIIMKPNETLYDTITRLSQFSPIKFCHYDACAVMDCNKIGCLNPFKTCLKELNKHT